MGNVTMYDLNTTMFDVSNYDGIMRFTNLSNYDAFFTPFTHVWLAVFGPWWWVLVIFLTTGVTLVKSREIFPTSIVLLLLSAVLTQAVPPEFTVILYLLMVLGFFGAMYGWFEDMGRY